MMTYTPVPFMDAKPVNDLIHKRPAFAYGFTVHQNKRSFKVGNAVKDVAPLSVPHTTCANFTHWQINAWRLANVFTYSPHRDKVGGRSSDQGGVFTYNPHSYEIGGVSREQGGIIFSTGGKLHYVGGFYDMPGYYGWVGVRLSMNIRCVSTLNNAQFHMLTCWAGFKFNCIDQTARNAYMIPVRKHPFIHDTDVAHLYMVRT